MPAAHPSPFAPTTAKLSLQAMPRPVPLLTMRLLGPAPLPLLGPRPPSMADGMARRKKKRPAESPADAMQLIAAGVSRMTLSPKPTQAAAFCCGGSPVR